MEGNRASKVVVKMGTKVATQGAPRVTRARPMLAKAVDTARASQTTAKVAARALEADTRGHASIAD